MQNLFPGVFILEGQIGGRPLRLVYLQGSDSSLLLDTGCAQDPHKFIAPQISEAGGKVADLTWILNSHPDLDHIGGNRAMRQMSRKAVLACGALDRHMCQGIDNLMAYRYDVYREKHGIFYSGATRDWLYAEGGQNTPINVAFLGGEWIHLGSGWELEVLLLPGHSAGHLGLLDRRHHALYGADAIHGSVYLGLDGSPMLCPTYNDVEAYLQTIHQIERLPITTYLGCHWPLKRSGEIAAFCQESRDFVRKTDTLLRVALCIPHTVRELCHALGPQLGKWPRDVDIELVYLLDGHLKQLVSGGIVIERTRASGAGIAEYVLRSQG